MVERDENQNAVRQHVAFAMQLTHWMERAGAPDDETQADLGVGIADIIFAASQAEAVVSELVRLDPRTAEGAARALEHLGYLNALFLTEIKDHLSDLERRWPVLEQCLASTAGFDDDEVDINTP